MKTTPLLKKSLKSIQLIVLGLVVLFMQSSCAKMWFHFVDVKGRILNASNLQPIMTEVIVNVDDPSSSKESQMGRYSFASTLTDSNGEFRIKSKAARRTAGYYFFITAKNANGVEQSIPIGPSSRGGGTLISLPLDKQVDLGNVLVSI